MDRDKKSRMINDHVLQNRLDFLLDLHSNGVDIGQTKRKLLAKHGVIKPEKEEVFKKKTITTTKRPSPIFRDYDIKQPAEIEADQLVDIEVRDAGTVDPVSQIITEEEYEKAEGDRVYSGSKKEIVKADWAPKGNMMDHDADFVKWIDSLMTGFGNRIRYKKFDLYVQQASDWLAENKSYSDYRN